MDPQNASHNCASHKPEGHWKLSNFGIQILKSARLHCSQTLGQPAIRMMRVNQMKLDTWSDFMFTKSCVKASSPKSALSTMPATLRVDFLFVKFYNFFNFQNLPGQLRSNLLKQVDSPVVRRLCNRVHPQSRRFDNFLFKLKIFNGKNREHAVWSCTGLRMLYWR